MQFDTSIFWEALTSYAFMEGAMITIALAVLAHGVAILLSVPMAICLAGRRSVLRGLVSAYVSIFRAVPTLLQLLFIWNALPQFFPVFRDTWFTPFLAAWIALSLNEAAYQVEINRASLQSVDPGQTAAGNALGLRSYQVYWYIVLPQAFRIALPPTVNEFISLLKLTSLASVISLTELMTVTQTAVARTFHFSEYYTVALIYYLVMVFALVAIQKRVERRFAWSDRNKAVGKATNDIEMEAIDVRR